MPITATPPARKSRGLFFDLSEPKPRGRKKSPRMTALSSLEVGRENGIVLDHTGYETPFSVWIAQARMREAKAFQYERVIDGKELYKVWVPRSRKEMVAHGSQNLVPSLT